MSQNPAKPSLGFFDVLSHALFLRAPARVREVSAEAQETERPANEYMDRSGAATERDDAKVAFAVSERIRRGRETAGTDPAASSTMSAEKTDEEMEAERVTTLAEITAEAVAEATRYESAAADRLTKAANLVGVVAAHPEAPLTHAYTSALLIVEEGKGWLEEAVKRMRMAESALADLRAVRDGPMSDLPSLKHLDGQVAVAEATLLNIDGTSEFLHVIERKLQELRSVSAGQEETPQAADGNAARRS